MKGYFDGGNEPDSRHYKIVTLGAFVGTNPQWRRFDRDWKRTVIVKHKARYTHATDAMSLQGVFADWNNARVDAMYSDCVTVIEEYAAVQGKRLGLLPVAMSILNEDFVRAYQIVPELGTAPQHLSVQCCEIFFQYGEKFYPGNHYRLFFDQNEPYYGHMADLRNSRKARSAAPIWDRVVTLAQADMRVTPGLQAADTLSWAINREYLDGKCSHEWQDRLLKLHREERILGYDQLIRPNPQAVSTVLSWKLPKRGKPR